MSKKYVVHDEGGLATMSYVNQGKAQTATYTWYRGDHCNYGPTLEHLENWQGFYDYFLKGFVPDDVKITPSTQITAFGSCFAANISKWLSARNYRVLSKKDEAARAYIVRMGEGMVNTHSIRQQFEWALEGKQPLSELWHGYDAKSFGYDPEVREETRAMFLNTEVFILTLGLSEVWYDKITNEVFWRAVPQENYDPQRHGFRLVRTEENYQNLRAIVELVKKHIPGAKIILTLSPIPLVATFRPMACTSANSASKGSLRMAVDQLISEANGKDVFYWPSYEIVLDGFAQKWKPDRRHVKEPILDFIMTLFEKAWCEGGISDQEIAGRLLEALCADGTVNARTAKILTGGNSSAIRTLCAKWVENRRTRMAETVRIAKSL